MIDLYNSSVPCVIVRGMTFPKTCDECRFLQADTFEAPFIGLHTTYSCAAMENQLEAGVPDGTRTTGRLEACPLDPLPEEIHTDCRIDLGPVWIRADEELPSNDRYVLCCCRTWTRATKIDKVCIGLFNGQRITTGIESDTVTHWMPLPNLPEEVQR